MQNTSLTYSPKDLKFLRDNYLFNDDVWLAKELGRTPYAIRTKRNNSGLHRYCRVAPKEVHKPRPEDIIKSIEREISALVNFIETTHSEVWREIANTRRLQLLKELKQF